MGEYTSQGLGCAVIAEIQGDIHTLVQVAGNITSQWVLLMSVHRLVGRFFGMSVIIS